MNNVMIDLEMLSTDPDGFICAIGAVAFDADGIDLPFYATIKTGGNGVIDADTVFWWLEQSKEVQAEFERTDILYPTLSQALTDFSLWLSAQRVQFVWGNGAASDNVWLRQAYLRNGLALPWDLKRDMCYRTIKNLHGRPGDTPTQEDTHHNALNDATWQAEHLINMNRRVGGLIL
jgi:hypothetical protein